MYNVKFSIITVCYNSEKTIIDTIESVLNQSYDNYEYIIVDGNSTDGTLSVIKEYEKRFKGKLKYISEPDNGIYDAMNKGIDIAQGELIGIINSDDWYEKNCLKNIVDYYQECEYSVYYGYMRTVDEMTGKEIRCARYNHEYIKEAMINHPTVFVSKNVYERFGKFNCKYKFSADYEFILRLIKEKCVHFIPVDEIQANFRTGGASEEIDALKETMKIKKKYGHISKIQYLASLIYLEGRKIFSYSIH